jgi:hypothetical protein
MHAHVVHQWDQQYDVGVAAQHARCCKAGVVSIREGTLSCSKCARGYPLLYLLPLLQGLRSLLHNLTCTAASISSDDMLSTSMSDVTAEGLVRASGGQSQNPDTPTSLSWRPRAYSPSVPDGSSDTILLLLLLVPMLVT